MICRNDLEPLERKIKKIKTSLNQIDIKNLLQDNWSNFCNHQENMTTFTNSGCFVNKWEISIRMQHIQLPFLQLKANNSKS